MNNANDSQGVYAIVAAASLAALVAFGDLLAGGRSDILVWACSRGEKLGVDRTLGNGAVVEIGGQRVGSVQGLPAVRSLLALLGLVLWQATSSSPSERAA